MKTDGTLESKDLMIGDFVWVEHYVLEDDVYVPTKPLEVIRIEDGEAIDIAIEDCYYPIKLTPEILEKNGWKDYDEIKEYQFEENGEKYRFYLKKMYKDGKFDCWGTNIGGVLPSLITYVHELQHALRLCGFNDLADNLQFQSINMTYEEWLKLPFKTDGKGDIITNKQGLQDICISRAARRYIKRQLEKGKIIRLQDMF